MISLPIFFMTLCVLITITLVIILLIKWDSNHCSNIPTCVLVPLLILCLAIDISCLITCLSGACEWG